MLSFEQTHKTAYSHGLEKIYSLETVDISTIKAIEDHKPQAKAKEPFKRWIPHDEPQISFQFGEGFNETLSPFVLREPVQMLELSKRVENHLLAQGVTLIQHLLPNSPEAMAWGKDLGQGHIDEVESKLQKYLEGTPLKQTKSVDFVSWLKTLTTGITPKKGAALLESHALPPLIPLSSAEKWEWHHLSEEKKRLWTEEALCEFQEEAKKQQVIRDLKQITEVFIKPWLEKRFQLATEAELQERLLTLSEAAAATAQILDWLRKVYFEDTFPLSYYLYPLEGDQLYTLDARAAKEYHIIAGIAASYFYSPHVHYPLHHLAIWILREAAKKWHNFSLPHIEKILRLSPRFRVRKSTSGELTVRLNPLFDAHRV